MPWAASAEAEEGGKGRTAHPKPPRPWLQGSRRSPCLCVPCSPCTYTPTRGRQRWNGTTAGRRRRAGKASVGGITLSPPSHTTHILCSRCRGGRAGGQAGFASRRRPEEAGGVRREPRGGRSARGQLGALACTRARTHATTGRLSTRLHARMRPWASLHARAHGTGAHARAGLDAGTHTQAQALGRHACMHGTGTHACAHARTQAWMQAYTHTQAQARMRACRV